MHGLKNLGQTCFMNACLQAIYTTPSLLHFVMLLASRVDAAASDGKELTPDCRVVLALRELFAGFMLEIDYTIETARPLCELLGFTQEQYNEQDDAGSFYKMLIGHIEFAAKYVGIADEYRRIVEGTYENTIVCTSCGRRTTVYEQFTDLTLPLPQAGSSTPSNIFSCLINMLSTEVLKDDNAYYCEQCNASMRATKCIAIKSGVGTNNVTYTLPDALSLTLGRFSIDAQYNISKNAGVCVFPVFAHFAPFLNYFGERILSQMQSAEVVGTDAPKSPGNSSHRLILDGTPPHSEQDSKSLSPKSGHSENAQKPPVDTLDIGRISDTDSSPTLQEVQVPDVKAQGDKLSERTFEASMRIGMPWLPGQRSNFSNNTVQPDPFMVPTCSFVKSNDSIFVLSTVIVHSGSFLGGHYYSYHLDPKLAFFRRFGNSATTEEEHSASINDLFSMWKLNDSVVTVVDDISETLSSLFGSHPLHRTTSVTSLASNDTDSCAYPSSAFSVTAYILMYSKLNTLLPNSADNRLSVSSICSLVPASFKEDYCILKEIQKQIAGRSRLVIGANTAFRKLLGTLFLTEQKDDCEETTLSDPLFSTLQSCFLPDKALCGSLADTFRGVFSEGTISEIHLLAEGFGREASAAAASAIDAAFQLDVDSLESYLQVVPSSSNTEGEISVELTPEMSFDELLKGLLMVICQARFGLRHVENLFTSSNSGMLLATLLSCSLFITKLGDLFDEEHSGLSLDERTIVFLRLYCLLHNIVRIFDALSLRGLLGTLQRHTHFVFLHGSDILAMRGPIAETAAHLHGLLGNFVEEFSNKTITELRSFQDDILGTICGKYTTFIYGFLFDHALGCIVQHIAGASNVTFEFSAVNGSTDSADFLRSPIARLSSENASTLLSMPVAQRMPGNSGQRLFLELCPLHNLCNTMLYDLDAAGQIVHLQSDVRCSGYIPYDHNFIHVRCNLLSVDDADGRQLDSDGMVLAQPEDAPDESYPGVHLKKIKGLLNFTDVIDQLIPAIAIDPPAFGSLQSIDEKVSYIRSAVADNISAICSYGRAATWRVSSTVVIPDVLVFRTKPPNYLSAAVLALGVLPDSCLTLALRRHILFSPYMSVLHMKVLIAARRLKITTRVMARLVRFLTDPAFREGLSSAVRKANEAYISALRQLTPRILFFTFLPGARKVYEPILFFEECVALGMLADDEKALVGVDGAPACDQNRVSVAPIPGYFNRRVTHIANEALVPVDLLVKRWSAVPSTAGVLFVNAFFELWHEHSKVDLIGAFAYQDPAVFITHLRATDRILQLHSEEDRLVDVHFLSRFAEQPRDAAIIASVKVKNDAVMRDVGRAALASIYGSGANITFKCAYYTEVVTSQLNKKFFSYRPAGHEGVTWKTFDTDIYREKSLDMVLSRQRIRTCGFSQDTSASLLQTIATEADGNSSANYDAGNLSAPFKILDVSSQFCRYYIAKQTANLQALFNAYAQECDSHDTSGDSLLHSCVFSRAFDVRPDDFYAFFNLRRTLYVFAENGFAIPQFEDMAILRSLKELSRVPKDDVDQALSSLVKKLSVSLNLYLAPFFGRGDAGTSDVIDITVPSTVQIADDYNGHAIYMHNCIMKMEDLTFEETMRAHQDPDYTPPSSHLENTELFLSFEGLLSVFLAQRTFERYICLWEWEHDMNGSLNNVVHFLRGLSVKEGYVSRLCEFDAGSLRVAALVTVAFSIMNSCVKENKHLQMGPLAESGMILPAYLFSTEPTAGISLVDTQSFVGACLKKFLLSQGALASTGVPTLCVGVYPVLLLAPARLFARSASSQGSSFAGSLSSSLLSVRTLLVNYQPLLVVHTPDIALESAEVLNTLAQYLS